jgi:LacI family transcriptional regulator
MTDDTEVVGGAAIPFRRPGETDVARLARVSQKTVSRVINGESQVREQERVLGAARELGRNPDVAAILVANDGMAIDVIGAFTELRLSVPEDVSVLRLDDNPSAAFFTPPLTRSLRSSIRRAVSGLPRLVREIEARGQEGPMQPRRLPRLAIRRSTRQPPAIGDGQSTELPPWQLTLTRSDLGSSR